MKHILLFLLLLLAASISAMDTPAIISKKLVTLCESPDTNLLVIKEYVADLTQTQRKALTNETLTDGSPVMQAALKACVDNSLWDFYEYLLSIFDNWSNLNLDILFDSNLTDEQCETAVDIFCKYKYYQPSTCILF